MNSTSQLYNHVGELLGLGALAWGADTLKLALLGSGYVFDAEHTAFADIAAYEVSGEGYAAGGLALSGATVIRSSAVTALDAADLTISGITATFRFGVVYVEGAKNGVVNPLVKHILFDDTPADIALAGDALPIAWGPGGLARLTVG